MATAPSSAPAMPMVAPPLPAGLDTPELVVDLDVVERNARRLAEALASRAIALRPHVKTHKSVALARFQLDAGARGLTVGNLGEAEVFADGGIDDLFVAYPIWAEGPKAARLRALHERPDLRLAIGFDSVEDARRLAAAVAGSCAGRALRVVLELDPGNRRTGAPPEEAGEIAAAARGFGLEVLGVFTHGGHAYRPGAAEPAGADEVRALTTGANALRAGGIEPQVISAGSTPTQLTAAVDPVALIVGVAVLAFRPTSNFGDEPTSSPPVATTPPSSEPSSSVAAAPIADGTYAVDLPVSEILADLDPDTTLTADEKTAVIDSILGIRGATTLNLRMIFGNGTMVLQQAVDGGSFFSNSPWRVSVIDEETIAFATGTGADLSVQGYQVVRSGDGRGFTLRPASPPPGTVEAFVRQTLFQSADYLPIQ